MWLIAPLLGLLAGLALVAARSRRHPKPDQGGNPPTATREPEEGKGDP